MISRPYWHIHHETLLEWNTEPIANRRKYIREEKPQDEAALRLKLLKPVKGKLPAQVLKAWDAYDKAWAAYVKAGAAYVKAGAAYVKAGTAYVKARTAYDKAWAAYDKAIKDNMPALEALHERECPNCPWNGKTIFP